MSKHEIQELGNVVILQKGAQEWALPPRPGLGLRGF